MRRSKVLQMLLDSHGPENPIPRIYVDPNNSVLSSGWELLSCQGKGMIWRMCHHCRQFFSRKSSGNCGISWQRRDKDPEAGIGWNGLGREMQLVLRLIKGLAQEDGEVTFLQALQDRITRIKALFQEEQPLETGRVWVKTAPFGLKPSNPPCPAHPGGQNNQRGLAPNDNKWSNSWCWSWKHRGSWFKTSPAVVRLPVLRLELPDAPILELKRNGRWCKKENILLLI